MLNGVGEHPASKGKSYLFWKDSENNFIFTSALEKERKAEEIKKNAQNPLKVFVRNFADKWRVVDSVSPGKRNTQF